MNVVKFLKVTVNIKNMTKIRSINWNVLHIFCVILIFNRQERMYLLQNAHNDSMSLVTLKSLISMEFFLFFFRKFCQLHALLEPPRLLITEKPATNTVFYVINI